MKDLIEVTIRATKNVLKVYIGTAVVGLSVYTTWPFFEALIVSSTGGL